MISFNQVTFLGNAGSDPEVRKKDDGKVVAKFTLAVNIFTKGKEEPLWLRVNCWQELADRVAKVVSKGTLVLVSGRLDVQKYTDKANVERTSVEVVAYTVQVLPAGPRAKAGAGHEEEVVV